MQRAALALLMPRVKNMRNPCHFSKFLVCLSMLLPSWRTLARRKVRFRHSELRVHVSASDYMEAQLAVHRMTLGLHSICEYLSS